MMTNNYYNIPERFRTPKSKVYCVHQDKVPIYGTLPNKLSTFYSFDEAISLIKEGQGLGIGMWGILCGIDIDHCINDDGIISSEAQEIIDYFDSYTETSVSGHGVHILFLCKEQHKDKDTYYVKLGKKHMKEKKITGMEGLEFYQGLHDHRYLTLTGNKIHEMNHEYISGERVQAFLDKYFRKPTPPTPTLTSFSSSDDEDKAWIKWALLVRKPERLMKGWFRHPTGSGGTESEDDLEFMSNIAFWSNNNPSVMRAIFEASAYYKLKDDKHKKKWARQDYSEGVIAKAMQSTNVAKVYFQDSFCYDSNSKTIKEVL